MVTAYLKSICAALRQQGCVCLAITLCIAGLWNSPAHGYVLKGPHVLDLMTHKLAGAKTLLVDQQVIIEDPAVAGQTIELSEKLSYIFPDRFRSEIQHADSHRIQVLSQGQALTIVDDTIASEQEGRFDRYKDLLLYNSRQLLHKMLYTHGVDVGITSLGRMDDHIVWVVGANYPDVSVSQVWVDKERFVPLRWINVFPSENADGGSDRVEFVYSNWQNLDGVWYPMQIETYHNGKPVRRVRVVKVQANAVIPGESLNISHLMTVYKKADAAHPDDAPPATGVDEVQQTIEDFRKKFEP